MSIHLMLVAAYLPKEVVTPTQKLVLMKICDAADDQTQMGRPGLERMMAWAGVGEKRIATLVTQLVELGLVERVEVGRARRRAEYKVFPLGLLHIPSTEELVERRKEAQRAPRNPKLARKVSGRLKPSAAVRTHQDAAERHAARPDSSRREAGDGETGALPQGNPPGPARVSPAKPSGFREGNPSGEARVAPAKPSGFPQGNPLGFPGETPSVPPPSYLSTYPPPHTAGDVPDLEASGPQAAEGCSAHEQPAANCRGCGTNPRAARDRARRQEAEAERHTEQTQFRRYLAEQKRRVAEADPQKVAEARAYARSLARKKSERLTRPDNPNEHNQGNN